MNNDFTKNMIEKKLSTDEIKNKDYSNYKLVTDISNGQRYKPVSNYLKKYLTEKPPQTIEKKKEV
jgi:peptide methionine sulfoxide reductase MsrA